MGLTPVLFLCLVVLLALAYKRLKKPTWLGRRDLRELEVVDRLPLTHQHSIHLVTVRDRWLVVATTPQGCSVLESGSATPGSIVQAAGASH